MCVSWHTSRTYRKDDEIMYVKLGDVLDLINDQINRRRSKPPYKKTRDDDLVIRVLEDAKRDIGRLERCDYADLRVPLERNSKENSNSSENLTGWVSVSERLPDEKGEYLTTIDVMQGLTVVGKCVMSQQWDGIGWKVWGTTVNVTAWRELPSPYKENE